MILYKSKEREGTFLCIDHLSESPPKFIFETYIKSMLSLWILLVFEGNEFKIIENFFGANLTLTHEACFRGFSSEM